MDMGRLLWQGLSYLGRNSIKLGVFKYKWYSWVLMLVGIAPFFIFKFFTIWGLPLSLLGLGLIAKVIMYEGDRQNGK